MSHKMTHFSITYYYKAFKSRVWYTSCKRCARTIAQEGRELNLFSSAIKLPTQYMHTLWFTLRFTDTIQHEEIMENLYSSEFLMATEKMSSNKVFCDHGYHGRLLSHGIVAEQSLHVKDNVLTGYCFTPQDGNALLSSVAGTVQHYYKDNWTEKMKTFNRYISKYITLEFNYGKSYCNCNTSIYSWNYMANRCIK